MKTFVYALTVAATLSAAPAFAGSASDTAVRPDDEQNAPLAAQLEAAQRGVGPTFGNDDRATPPAQEQAPGQSGMTSAPHSNNGVTIAPYPSSERPPFDGGS